MAAPVKISKPLEQQLIDAIADSERAATQLSNVLNQFDLAEIPFCDRNLNTVDVGAKILVAKFLLSVLQTRPKE